MPSVSDLYVCNLFPIKRESLSRYSRAFTRDRITAA
jgi:hypothetical protein